MIVKSRAFAPHDGLGRPPDAGKTTYRQVIQIKTFWRFSRTFFKKVLEPPEAFLIYASWTQAFWLTRLPAGSRTRIEFLSGSVMPK